MRLTTINASQSVRIAIGAPFGGSAGIVVSHTAQTAMVRVDSVILPYSLSELRRIN